MLIESLGILPHLCARLHRYGIRFARDLKEWTEADMELLLGRSNMRLVAMASRARGFPLRKGDPAEARERLETKLGVRFLELAQPAGAPPRLVLEGSPEHRELERASAATTEAMKSAGYEEPPPEVMARAATGGPAFHFDRGAFKARQEERSMTDADATGTSLCFVGAALENTRLPNITLDPRRVTCHRCLGQMVRVISVDEVADAGPVEVSSPSPGAPAMHYEKPGSNHQSFCFDKEFAVPLPNTTTDQARVNCPRCRDRLRALEAPAVVDAIIEEPETT